MKSNKLAKTRKKKKGKNRMKKFRKEAPSLWGKYLFSFRGEKIFFKRIFSGKKRKSTYPLAPTQKKRQARPCGCRGGEKKRKKGVDNVS